MKRRIFLKNTLASSIIFTAASAGLLTPIRALASDWPKNAFAAKDIASALNQLYGNSAVSASKEIKIKAPLQAENGAVVPVSVTISLPKVESMSIFVKENVQPLVASVNLPKATGYFSGRVKMAKTSDVLFVVKSNGNLYSAVQNIKVTVGGCGG